MMKYNSKIAGFSRENTRKRGQEMIDSGMAMVDAYKRSIMTEDGATPGAVASNFLFKTEMGFEQAMRGSLMVQIGTDLVAMADSSNLDEDGFQTQMTRFLMDFLSSVAEDTHNSTSQIMNMRQRMTREVTAKVFDVYRDEVLVQEFTEI